MKKFDFNDPEFKKSCIARQEFLLSFHNKPVTEGEFVGAVNAMPKHEHWSKTHSPSKAKYDYRRLKANFGFFEVKK